MKRITLNRGEALGLLVTAKSGGVPIVLDGTWTLAASARVTGGDATVSFPVELTPEGKALIIHDTVAMAPGVWLTDIRFTNTGRDQWSEVIEIHLSEPITPPSPR